MNPAEREGLPRNAAGLMVFVFACAAALSLKCCFDLARHADRFPGWFVPLFIAGMAVLLVSGGLVTWRTWNGRDSVRWASGPAAWLVWVLLPLSFVCTSSVHGFYPFRPAPLGILLAQDAVFLLNMGLALGGFLVSALCGVLYASGRRQAAVLLLLCFGVLLLAPNDDCRNPFNYWWLAHVGASPLVFVPNMFAIVFGTAALADVHPRLSTLALAGIGLSVGLLGLGHMTRVLW